MNLSTIVGVAIGLAFTYLLLSLVCSTMQEWIAAVFRRRAAGMHEGLLALIRDPGQLQNFYSNPLIKSLVPPSTTLKMEKAVSYIPSNNFATALIETVAPLLLAPGANVAQAINTISIQPPELEKALKALANRANGDREKFLAAVEKWFNDTMDRVSGWYKRETQIIIIVLSVIATVAFNVDTIRIAQELYKNAGLREAIGVAANQYIVTHQRPQPPNNGANNDGAQDRTTTPKTTPAVETTRATSSVAPPAANTSSTASTTSGGTATSGRTATISTTKEQDGHPAELQQNVDELMKLMNLNLPIGWRKGVEFNGWSLVGWLLTIAAVSLGAPFWFDVLVRVANIRNNGPKPDTTVR